MFAVEKYYDKLIRDNILLNFKMFSLYMNLYKIFFLEVVECL